MFVGGTDGTVRAWSVSRDQVGPPLLDHGHPISAVQTSASGRYLAAGDESGSVSVVDLRDRSVSRLSVRGPVDALAVADDGRWLAVASDVFSLTLGDLRAGEVEQTARSEIPVSALAFRAGARALFVGGSTASVEIRDVPTLTSLTEPTISRTPAAFDVGAYSPNARHFGFYKFGVLTWETETLLRNPTIGSSGQSQEPDRQFPVGSTGGVTALAIAPDASRVAIATEGTISVVEPQLKEYDYGVQPGGPVTDPMTGISAETGALAFVGSGQRLVSASGSLLALWDPDQEARIARPLPVRLPDLGMATETPGLSLARGGRIVAWTSSEPEVGIWEEEMGPRTPPIPPGFVYYDPVALSKDGGRVVAAGNEGIHIWDLAGSSGPVQVPSSGRLGDSVGMLEGDTSPDSMFAVWDDGRIDRLSLDAAELQPLAEPSDSGYLGEVDCAPEVGLAVEVTEEGVSQIDLATGRRSPGPKLGLPTVSAVALSRDGHLLVAADGEESAVLWDMRQGEALRRMAVGRVINIALSPDARLMATVTGEGLMSLWDVGSGNKLGEVQLREGESALSTDRGYETALRFSPDGDLWTATAGGGLIRWPMSPEAWAQSICETVNRSLTQDEWDRYIGTSGSATFSCPDS